MSATPDNDEPGEFYCPDCHCQCTRSPTDPGLEYGHAGVKWSRDGVRCPRRPESLDTTRHGGWGGR